MTAFTESACLPIAMDNAVQQRKLMAKIADERSKIIDLRLDVGDALADLVDVTEWADDASAEQKAALEKVTDCRMALAKTEARVAYLQRRLEESC